jgi:fucose 4-O-acetylase-like acetyltransferase
LTFFVWRHVDGQVPASAALAVLMDKWQLGPLRLLDFGALLVLVVHVRDAIARRAQHSALTDLGKASLTVFCAHLVICLSALAIVPEPGATLHWQDSALLAATLLALYAIARAYLASRRMVPAILAFSARRPASRTAR